MAWWCRVVASSGVSSGGCGVGSGASGGSCTSRACGCACFSARLRARCRCLRSRRLRCLSCLASASGVNASRWGAFVRPRSTCSPVLASKAYLARGAGILWLDGVKDRGMKVLMQKTDDLARFFSKKRCAATTLTMLIIGASFYYKNIIHTHIYILYFLFPRKLYSFLKKWQNTHYPSGFQRKS